MKKDKIFSFKPLPFFLLAMCALVIVAYIVYIYTNIQQQQKLTKLLGEAFNTTVIIDNFEYSPISKNVKINNIKVFFPNNKAKVAIIIKNIRSNIEKLPHNNIKIKNMKISDISIYSKKYDAEDILQLFKIPTTSLQKNQNEYGLIIENIDIEDAILYMPNIDNSQSYIKFPLSKITLSNIKTNNYKAVFATIFDTYTNNIQKTTFKYRINHKLKSGSLQIQMLKKHAFMNAKTQLNKIEKELENTNNKLQTQIQEIGNSINKTINSLKKDIDSEQLKE